MCADRGALRTALAARRFIQRQGDPAGERIGTDMRPASLPARQRQRHGAWLGRPEGDGARPSTTPPAGRTGRLPVSVPRRRAHDSGTSTLLGSVAPDRDGALFSAGATPRGSRRGGTLPASAQERRAHESGTSTLARLSVAPTT
jgi:hypothetical protein